MLFTNITIIQIVLHMHLPPDLALAVVDSATVANAFLDNAPVAMRGSSDFLLHAKHAPSHTEHKAGHLLHEETAKKCDNW
jgi:hypothetical protein